MTVEVRVANAGQVEVLSDTLGDLTPVMDSLGALLTARSQASFRTQGKRGRPWPPRLTPNVPGIIRDLNSGGSPKARRFQPRPALVDTGTLRRSITWEVSGSGREVTVGTNVPYAKLHNEGGDSTSTLTSQGRQRLAAWLRRDPTNRVHGLGFLFSQPSVTVAVRKRAFLDLTSDDRKLIVDHIEAGISDTVRVRGR